MSDLENPERIFLTDAFDDDGLFWVKERMSEDDEEYIRKDIAEKNIQEILQLIRDALQECILKGGTSILSDACCETLRRADK